MTGDERSTHMPLVSVVIPCYNAAPWIADAVASVAAQDYPHVETIVVDDGSTDESASIVAERFPHVHLVRQENRGASRARNAGTSRASGEYIQYLDADDVLAPGKIRRQVDALQSSQADIAYGDYEIFRALADGSREVLSTHSPIMERPEVELFWDLWIPPFVYLYRREIVERVGPWDESLQIGEDALFVLFCAEAGARFVRCPGTMGGLRADVATSMTRSNPQRFVRGRLAYIRGVHARWKEQGLLHSERREALVRAYATIARTAGDVDADAFREALAVLETVAPGYRPPSPPHLTAVSRVLGYRRAEHVALAVRRLRKVARRTTP